MKCGNAIAVKPFTSRCRPDLLNLCLPQLLVLGCIHKPIHVMDSHQSNSSSTSTLYIFDPLVKPEATTMKAIARAKMTAYHLGKMRNRASRGCIDVCNFTIQINPTCFSWRVQKSIKQMDEMVKKYPMWEEPTARYLF